MKRILQSVVRAGVLGVCALAGCGLLSTASAQGSPQPLLPQWQGVAAASPLGVQAPAVRPFITDDANITGHPNLLLETWVRADRVGTEYWAIWGLGVTPWLETTVGGIMGLDYAQPQTLFTYAAPLVQGKVLFKPYAHRKPPGVAWVLGTFLPYGQGSLRPTEYGAFSYVAFTQCAGANDRLLLHLNLGGGYRFLKLGMQEPPLALTLGGGAQQHIWKWLYAIGELFYGDPYSPTAGLSWQTGIRVFVSNRFQVDATVGQGITGGEGRLPLWGSTGIRWVSKAVWKPKPRVED